MLTDSRECKLYVFLKDKHSLGGNTIPSPILPTTGKRNLIIVHQSSKSFTIVQLSIPFDTKTSKSHDYMTTKYLYLMCEITGEGYSCKFLVVAIGSQEYISEDSKVQLASLFHKLSKREIKKVSTKLSKTAMVSSCVILILGILDPTD